jgi:trigger factor
MNISQEKIDNLNTVVTINIKPEDYQPRVEKAIKDHAKKAKIPGFRPGMVPPSHIKKMYGKSILVDEVNNMLSDTLNNYLEEQQMQVLGQPLPKVDDKEYAWDFSDDFVFNYEVGLAPAFDIDFSTKDKVTQYVIKAEKETLEERIKNLRRAYGKMTNPDVSADNDVLYAELVQLSPDGSVFEGGISATTSVRLEDVKDAKVKKSLIGLKKGDEVAIDIEKIVDAITGKDKSQFEEAKSNFRLSVKNVNRLEESELDQAFFDKLFGEGKVTSEESFREEITKEVEGMFSQDTERKLQNDLYKLAIEKAKFELPDEFLKRWLKATNDKLTEEELTGGYEDFAKNLKWTLIENKIITDNKIEIKYEDVFALAKQRLDAQFRMYSPQPLSEEQLAQYTVQFLQNKDQANKIFEEVKAVKVLDHLKSVVTLDQTEISDKKFAGVAND